MAKFVSVSLCLSIVKFADSRHEVLFLAVAVDRRVREKCNCYFYHTERHTYSHSTEAVASLITLSSLSTLDSRSRRSSFSPTLVIQHRSQWLKLGTRSGLDWGSGDSLVAETRSVIGLSPGVGLSVDSRPPLVAPQSTVFWA